MRQKFTTINEVFYFKIKTLKFSILKYINSIYNLNKNM